MLRKSTSSRSPIPPSPFLPSLDIPFPELRSYVGAHPRKSGVTVATLLLAIDGPHVPQPPDDLNMDVLAIRPTFPLTPSGSEFTLVFPVVQSSDGKSSSFFLDFTDNGKYPGVVMSQSRMREVETIVNPLAGIGELNSVPLTMFGSGSWVDLLVGPELVACCMV